MIFIGAICSNVSITQAERLQRQADKKLKEIDEKMKNFSDLTDRYRKKKIKLETNRKELEDWENDLEEQSKKIQDLRKKYRKKYLELEDTKQDVALFREDLDDYSQQLNDLPDYQEIPATSAELQGTISRCRKQMDLCNEHISRLKADITQDETELRQIKQQIAICQRSIVHAIDDLKRLKQELEKSQESLNREKNTNIVREDTDTRNYTIDAWLHKIFLGAWSVGFTSGIVTFLTGVLINITIIIDIIIFVL